MLKQRIITAVAMLAVLLPALFYGSPVPFIAIALVLMAAASWEWSRLNGAPGLAAWALAAVCVALCAATWWSGALETPHRGVWIVGGAVWVLSGAALLRAGPAGWPPLPQGVRLIGGVLALWLAWLAVAQARIAGINFLLSVLVLVWVADIGAYFAGRAFGQRWARGKLAPAISPGKSWEGAWGGMLCVLVLAVAWAIADRQWLPSVPSLYSRLAVQGWWLLVLGSLFLSAMSVVGDLVESLVKRAAGAKDSSQLLPGHGGVLDRVDALLPTLPLAMMLATVFGP